MLLLRVKQINEHLKLCDNFVNNKKQTSVVVVVVDLTGSQWKDLALNILS
jgi:hypothetical protein